MRGTQSVRRNNRPSVRIIPAHAGNTVSIASCSGRRQDHPRTCGEHFLTRHVRQMRQESSPHMRGTFPRIRPCTGTGGIIPAHAGNTRRLGPISSTCRDHPRTCGEHALQIGFPRTLAGSSPHMRGTLEVLQRIFHGDGIIPAHAGNTTRFRWAGT